MCNVRVSNPHGWIFFNQNSISIHLWLKTFSFYGWNIGMLRGIDSKLEYLNLLTKLKDSRILFRRLFKISVQKRCKLLYTFQCHRWKIITDFENKQKINYDKCLNERNIKKNCLYFALLWKLVIIVSNYLKCPIQRDKLLNK